MTAFANTLHLYPTEQLTVSYVCHFFLYPWFHLGMLPILPVHRPHPHYTMTQLMCSLHSYALKFLFVCRQLFAFVFCITPFLAISQGFFLALKLPKGPTVLFYTDTFLRKHSPSPTVDISDSAIIRLCADQGKPAALTNKPQSTMDQT